MRAPGTERAGSAGARHAGVRWVMLIYFLSGACSLIDEVVWVRLLKLTLGNTVYASCVVVSVFMGGLALGAYIMGRFADRVKRRLRLYALLELAVTVSALSLPFVLRFADGAYRWVFLHFDLSPGRLLAVQVVVSTTMLLVPTMFMGSTLPLLGRYVTALEDRVGNLVGRLYALNTLGAAAGCFLAGFVLIRAFGVMGALYVAAGLNVVVACGGYLLSRSHDVPVQEEALPQRQRAAAPMMGGAAGRYVLVSAFFFSGLVSIGYELIWMRSIVYLLGGFTYVFSAVLTVYLVGNVIGAWISSRISPRVKHPAAAFGVSLACLGLLGIVYVPWLSAWYFAVSPPLANGLGVVLNHPSVGKLAYPVFHSVFLFLAPTIAMGIGFPLALQGWARYRHQVGETTGTVYAANTIGAVLGGAATGFWLIPYLGAQRSIMILGLAGAWLGGALILVHLGDVALRRRLACLLLPVGCTVVAACVPARLFERSIMARPGSHTLAVREGVTTTVEVIRNRSGHLEMAVDNVLMAGDDIHRSAQKTLGHLGVLIHPGVREVLSVGFGCGETTACLARHDLDRIDCVEIAPEVVEAGLDFFSHINLGDRLDDEVNMIYMDAKNYIHLTDRRYDLIINGGNRHSTSGSAPLFAKEHFERARDHLKPGGLFMTKVHLAGPPRANFDSILGTFAQVFPHTTVWFPTTKPYSFFYLVGSVEEQRYSPKRIEEELAKKPVRESVAYMNFRSSQDVLSCYIGDERDFAAYLRDFRVNSDYNPYVEFNRNQSDLIGRPFFRRFVDSVRSRSVLEHLDWSGLSDAQREAWLREDEVTYQVSTYVLRSRSEEDHVAILRNSFDGLQLAPGHPTLLEQERQALYSLRKALANAPQQELMMRVGRLLEERPACGAGWLVRSWAHMEMGDMGGALAAADTAVQHTPTNAEAQSHLGMLLVRLGRLEPAATHCGEAVRLAPDEARFRYNYGIALGRQNLLDQAIAQFREGLKLRPDDGMARTILGDLLIRSGQPEEAVLELNEALRVNPDDGRAREMLNVALSSTP